MQPPEETQSQALLLFQSENWLWEELNGGKAQVKPHLFFCGLLLTGGVGRWSPAPTGPCTPPGRAASPSLGSLLLPAEADFSPFLPVSCLLGSVTLSCGVLGVLQPQSCGGAPLGCEEALGPGCPSVPAGLEDAAEMWIVW